MSKFKDLTGQKFHNLTVLSFAYRDKKNTYWLCKCNCGNKKIIRGSHLTSGNTKSCGCLMKYNITRRNKENAIHGKSNTRLYTIYAGMKARCLKPNTNSYENYGEKGITICNEWLNDFMCFYNWAINNGYKENLSLERIDNNQGYEPSNCKWIEKKLQSRNIKSNKMISFRGKTLCMAEWAEQLGINYNTLNSRLGKYNWSIKKALTTPTKK